MEKLHFKIGLGATYWDKKPAYSVLVNDQVVVPSTVLNVETAVDCQCSDIHYVEFDHEVAEGPCTLQIRLDNKNQYDTIQTADKTAIVKDLLLHIRTVEIDEINLGNIIYTHTKFVGDDPERPVLEQCQDLGWNGAWTLPFESPFYIWLLENI